MTGRPTELAWRIGGPQGSGVDTAAALFARTCAHVGLHLFGRREYYSNIMGRHSYYDVRAAHRALTCHRETVDLLTTFDVESLARHSLAVVAGGGLIYDVDERDVPLERIPFLDAGFWDELGVYLRAHGLPESTTGLIDDARQRGVHLFQVSYDTIIQELARALSLSATMASRTLNTIAVAISCALLRFDPDYLIRALAAVFRGRSSIIEMNTTAIEQTYAYVRDTFALVPFSVHLESEPTSARRLFLNGTQAVALGKIASGMTFQTYYPISPATDESTYLEAHDTYPTNDGEEGSVTVIQTEDELAAINMAAGAALTGARSATATSGPGFSLMAEGLGWAGINEVPLVVTLYQRGGPWDAHPD